MEKGVYYSREYLEKYFKENYPINWYTWLSNVFDKLDASFIIGTNLFIGADLSSQERK